jgi:hypothetical protein
MEAATNEEQNLMMPSSLEEAKRANSVKPQEQRGSQTKGRA